MGSLTSYLMSLITAADAIAALNVAGHSARKSPARSRVGRHSRTWRRRLP